MAALIFGGALGAQDSKEYDTLHPVAKPASAILIEDTGGGAAAGGLGALGAGGAEPAAAGRAARAPEADLEISLLSFKKEMQDSKTGAVCLSHATYAVKNLGPGKVSQFGVKMSFNSRPLEWSCKSRSHFAIEQDPQYGCRFDGADRTVIKSKQSIVVIISTKARACRSVASVTVQYQGDRVPNNDIAVGSE